MNEKCGLPDGQLKIQYKNCLGKLSECIFLIKIKKLIVSKTSE